MSRQVWHPRELGEDQRQTEESLSSSSQSATPGSGSASTVASVSDTDDKFIKVKEDMKLDEVAEWASEMILAC